MKGFINISLALVTLVYMTLPNCPCQLLEPLGFNFPHKHLNGEPEGNPDYDGHRSIGKKAPGSDTEMPLCMCEEGMMKTAEETENESSLYDEVRSNVAEVTADFSGEHAPCFRHGFSVPPPEVERLALFDRVFTGVYRL